MPCREELQAGSGSGQQVAGYEVSAGNNPAGGGGMKQTLKYIFFHRLTLICSLIFTACIMVAGLFLYLMLSLELGPDYASSFSRIEEMRQALPRLTLYVYMFSFVVTVAGILIVTLIYSHRIAGPVYRIIMEARRVADGELGGTVRLRRNDLLHPVADRFNAMKSRYCARISTLRELANQYDAYIRPPSGSMHENGGAEELEKLKLSARARIKMLRLKAGE